MPPLSLKYTNPFGLRAMARTPDELSWRTASPVTPSRPAFRLRFRISPLPYTPTSRSPSAAAPRPHPSQKATPVGTITGVHSCFGPVGDGPSVLVFGHPDP